MTRVLIVGANGMLGHKLYQVLSEDPQLDVHGTLRASEPLLAGLNGTIHEGIALEGDLDSLRELIRRTAPRFILNAAGAIKQKDSRYAPMFHMNGAVPHILTLLDPTQQARVLHFSTDCVFTGTRGNYTEADAPDAADAYGRSKASGEITYGQHLTVRTSIIGFELRSRVSLLSWIMNQQPTAALRGFTRAIYSGLPTVTLSKTIRALLREDVPLNGLYHVASRPIDKYTLLKRFSASMNLSRHLTPDDTFRCDRSLNDSRFRSATATETPDWDSLLHDLVSDYSSLPYHYPQHA